MKQLFKIRNNNRQKYITQSNVHFQRSPIHHQRQQHNSSFNQLVDMFKYFMDRSLQYNSNHHYQLDPRDRQVTIPPPNTTKNKSTQLKKWISQVTKTVVSVAFNSFSRKQMSFQQAKIYCSQNILKNLMTLNKKYHLNADELQTLDNQIKTGVLEYLGAKYPLTDSTQVNKALEAVLEQVDNIQSLHNNYLVNSNVLFQYRQDGNYNDLIMELINQMISLADRPAHDNLSIFQHFESYMGDLFRKVEDIDWMSEKNSKKNMDEQKQKYRARVREYTHFLIGSKIPQNTPTYSNIEIENKNIKIKTPSILRLLTKWCSELWTKYETPNYYSNRSQNVKTQFGQYTNTLFEWMRKYLDQRLQIQKNQIINYMKQLSQNNYQMQEGIINQELLKEGPDFLQEIQRVSGKFSVKVVRSLHSYVLAFLNRLIHGLLKISKKFHQNFGLSRQRNWPTPPNLLSFTIGDLMRCKCSSREKQILTIYKQLQNVSEKNPQILKIVRVKNRLRGGTNDILINIKFRNGSLCQIQLAVKSSASDFIKNSNLFHHYFYELQRSYFGPITQLCSIWLHLDQRCAIYENLCDQENKNVKKQKHSCERGQIIPYEKPFICSLCTRMYYHNNFLKTHEKCLKCKAIICGLCKIQGQSSTNIINSLILDKKIRKYCKKVIKTDQSLPSQGICIMIESKTPKLQIFTYKKANLNNIEYLLGKKDGKIYQIQNISKQKNKKTFRDRYLIIEMIKNEQYPIIQYQQQALKQYIIPKIIKQYFKKQKQSISFMSMPITKKQCIKLISYGNNRQRQSIKDILFSDNNFQQFPFESSQLPNIENIVLNRNPLKSLSGLQNCKKLKRFTAQQCQLKSLPFQIYSLENLQELLLSKNQISRVDEEIGDLKNIRQLKLDRNDLKNLPQKIQNCQNLNNLSIYSNKIQNLPQNIHLLNNLTILNSSQNALIQLPINFGKLKSLKELNLSKNAQLKILPSNFCELKNLQILNISQTGIESLSINFHHLSSLIKINLNSTKFNGQISQICRIKNIKEIDLGNCNPIILPQDIGQSTSLQNLILNDCKIQQIPQSFKELINLNYLDLSSNTLNKIDKNIFMNMSNLRYLNLSSTNIQQIPILNQCLKLRVLNISSNNIEEIQDQYINNLFNLEQLFINQNKLVYIPSAIFHFIKLKVLYINNNKLLDITFRQSFEEFKRLGISIWPNLEYCGFSSNQIQQFPLLLFKSPKLKNLNISDNKIKFIPSQIKLLSLMEYLNMSMNEIVQIPIQLSKLTQIRALTLNNNKITKIPIWIQNYSKLNQISFQGCPLKIIQCAEWIIKNKMLFCGTLRFKAQGYLKKITQLGKDAQLPSQSIISEGSNFQIQ